MVSVCCFKRCYERGLVIACWFVAAVWDCSPRGCLLRGLGLLARVWALFGIGDGCPGVGCFGVAWGWGMADYVQRSSGLLAACGAIDLCRGSPYLEVSGGGVLDNQAVFHSWLAYKIGFGHAISFRHPWSTDDGIDQGSRLEWLACSLAKCRELAQRRVAVDCGE